MASKMTRKDYLKSTAGGLLSVALLSKLGMHTQAAPVTDNLRSDGNSTGGGSTVEWNQLQDNGNKIAQITINGTTTDVFAPSGSGGGGRTETLLASGAYLKNDTVLLSEDYNEFDELVFITKNTNPDGFITNYIIKKSTTDYAVANDLKLELYGYANCFITLKFLDSRTISVLDGVGTILQVSGIKFVSGGAGYEIKTMKYTGTGGNLELDISDISFICGIYGNGLNGTNVCMLPFHVNSCGFITVYRYPDNSSGGFHCGYIEKVDNTLIFRGAVDDGGRCNIAGEEYTVYYT